MAELSIDRFVGLYSHRTSGMSASEVRALFAVASRPEVVSLAGGMRFVRAFATRGRARTRGGVLDEHGSMSLQYRGDRVTLRSLRARLAELMAAEGTVGDLRTWS